MVVLGLLFAMGVFLRMAVISGGAPSTPLAHVLVRNAPESGIVLSKVDLTMLAKRQHIASFAPNGLMAFDEQKHLVPVQFIPDEQFDPKERLTGWLLLKLPQGALAQVQLFYQPRPPEPARRNGTATLQSGGIVVEHDPKRMGGLPSCFLFRRIRSKEFATFVWNDRVHHRELGSFHLQHDPDPQVTLLSDGPIATVVRVRARYCQVGGKQPPSQPEATYHWFYFCDLPLVFVTIEARQREPFGWHEWHFLELNFSDESFRRWAGGEPLRMGDFTASQRSFGFPDWGALLDESSAIAVLRSGQALFHDGRGGYGTYLHPHGDRAWQGWNTTREQLSAWLFIGNVPEPIRSIRKLAAHLPSDAQVIVTLPEMRRIVEKASGWSRTLAERMEAQGRFDEAEKIAQGRLPPHWLSLRAGALLLALEPTKDGVRLQSLFDAKAKRELLAISPLPLVSLVLRHVPTKRETFVNTDEGWAKVTLQRSRNRVEVIWQQHRDERLAGIRIILTALLDNRQSALRWRLRVTNESREWSIWRVHFPQLAIADLGKNAEVFFPRGPGEVQRNLWQRSFAYRSLYPNGWATMQFVAVYSAGDREQGTGLYVGGHDPMGSAKDIVVMSEPERRRIVLAFELPAPNMGVAGNEFALSGEVVWQLFRGDWFDAALLYRNWVRKEARWMPKLGKEGRTDTPQWMKELCLWAVGGGAPKDCVPIVKEFAKFMGVPIGFHWYNWHAIPFDNDYPHYFPTKEGFAEGVRELQQAGLFVMPYINGRLWDTRDKGLNDWQFSAVALPAATKREDDTPYMESYGSKEADGSDVKLAPMCPTTRLWQEKVLEIVLRLFSEVGVNAVYIDQVAAAPPVLCFDKAHGHPLGGGFWWNEGYWRMLDAIRNAMPNERILTTECNAEPFIRWFDGYLTWHWQHDGQVPAFPAVYGGAIQMFGRAYGGGATKDLALRMKAGQQLVFGEQIGWIDPSVVREKGNAEFLRQVVRVRWHLRRFFYAGEMARPPKLWGDIPKVRADWQWAGEWWVETDAVLTGAWKLPQEGKLALLFVNVSDEPVRARLPFDAAAYGLAAKRLRATEVTEHGIRPVKSLPPRFELPLTFLPRIAWAWVLEAE